MEEMKKEQELNKEEAQIDQDVLDVVLKENIELTLGDSKLMNRAIFNAMCELYSVLKEFKTITEDLKQTINILSAKKLKDFFDKLDDNLIKEAKRNNTKKIIAKSHQKSNNKNKRK